MFIKERIGIGVINPKAFMTKEERFQYDIENKNRASAETKVRKNFAKLLNCFNSSLEECKNEEDYFGLMVAAGIFMKTVDRQFLSNLMEDVANPEEIQAYLDLKSECVENLNKKITNETMC